MTRAFWEDHHAHKRAVYPDEEVVRFLANTFPDAAARRGLRALDLGAGSGRHTVLLARWGFDAYAVDYSFRAVANTRDFLAREGLPGHVACSTLEAVPFRDAYLDFVLPWECLFYGDPPALERAVAEVGRVLKPGGYCFTNFRSPDDKHVEESEPLGGGAFLNRGEWEGVVFTALDEGETRALFARDFELVWFDRYLVTRRDRKNRDARWIVLVRKK